MASSQQQQTKPLGIFKTLHEAFILPAKSFTLILPILIIYLVSSKLLPDITSRSLNLTSKLTSVASIDPKNPAYALLLNNILKDLKGLTPVLAIFFIGYFVLSSLLDIATIHGFTLIHNSSKQPTYGDLLRTLGGGIKGPMITSLYVALLKLGYVLLIIIAISATSFVYVAHGSIVLVAFGAITVLIILFLYLYLSMVWSVSLIASVVEDGCYGLEALSKAWKIIKGRRMEGALLILIGVAIVGVVSSVFDFTRGYVNSLPTVEKMAIGFVYGVVFLVMRVFEWAICMVFYWDCKRINGEEGNKDTDQGKIKYVGLPVKVYDDITYIGCSISMSLAISGYGVRFNTMKLVSVRGFFPFFLTSNYVINV